MKAILFDLGGVLIDLAPSRVFEHWAKAADVTPASLAARWKIEAAYKAHEEGKMEFIEFTSHLQKQLGISITQSDWKTGWNALLGQPFPELLPRLSALAKRIPLYCFSNTNQTHWTALTARTNHPQLGGFFQKIYLSYAIGRRKPNVESYRWVTNDMGYRPTDIAFLDDNAANIHGAKRAGLCTTHVTSPKVVIDFLDTLTESRSDGG
jgi:putative hydrolase of the HAD superfamily|tara:strand:- start:472 stop:1095 length:624 start_codon:yes stop_codon:yes gene_type:complete